MPNFVMCYREGLNVRMNSAKWAMLLQPFADRVKFNPEQIGTKRFGFSASQEVADQIKAANPGLVIVEFVDYAHGPAPIDHQTIKDSLKNP